MVLGKLPVPGRPTNLDYSRARAYCACSKCGWGGLDKFSLVYHFSVLSPSLWETARYRLKYCLKGPLSPIQPTNQLMRSLVISIFLYACESLTLTAELAKRTQAFEIRCYRRLWNISYKDYITNEEVRRKIQEAIGEYDELLILVKK